MLQQLIRLFPNFRGKRRLMKFLYKETVKSGKNIKVNGKYGINYILPNLRESISFDIFVNGVYEKETFSFLNSLIPTNGVFLDLGANIGSISLPLIKNRPDIRCFCVEAAPWIFEYLQKNINTNIVSDKITLINKALLDRNGETLPFYSPKEQFGKGSLSPVFTQEAIPVISITVDELVKEYHLPNVDMIKIDIEGYEYFAFKGASELLMHEKAPEILFEFVDWAEENAGLTKGQAQQVLLDHGYQLFQLTINGKWIEHKTPLTTGSEMLFATKKDTNFAKA
ncbi:MAG TPA: FkbM family methyltransferase [Chitinophagaceae bacterium]